MCSSDLTTLIKGQKYLLISKENKPNYTLYYQTYKDKASSIYLNQKITIAKYYGDSELNIDNSIWKNNLSEIYTLNDDHNGYLYWRSNNSFNSLTGLKPNQYYVFVQKNGVNNTLVYNYSGFNNLNYNNCVGRVTTVGTNGGPSYYGTYDQNGNINEWTDSLVNNFQKIYAGGDYSSTASNLKALSYDAPSFSSSKLGFRVCAVCSDGNIEYVQVGDIGNNPDSYGYGSVNYYYSIGIYPVSNKDYIDLLNSVAKSDPYGLYNSSMSSSPNGGIVRYGSDGNYTYSTFGNMLYKPVTFVSWFQAARYCNWLHNGKTASSSTENGAYNLNGVSHGIIPKNPSAKYWIPSLDEWIKAAYYKGRNQNAGYWKYATQNDTDPLCITNINSDAGPYCAYAPDCFCVPTVTPTSTPTVTPTPGQSPTPTPTITPTKIGRAHV